MLSTLREAANVLQSVARSRTLSSTVLDDAVLNLDNWRSSLSTRSIPTEMMSAGQAV